MLLGIDISNNQGSIDWGSVGLHTAHGTVAFAFMKASEGTTYRDRYFAHNWAGARARGLAVGAYHFADFSSPARANAEFFLEILHGVGGVHEAGIPPALDVEVPSGVAEPAPGPLYRWIETWVAHVRREVGGTPVIYTGSLWKDVLGGCTAAWGCPLWLAQYSSRPVLPRAWRRWTFWQFTDTGVLPGVGAVDMNWFAGDRHGLRHGSGRAAGPHPPPRPPRRRAHAGPPAWPGRVLRRGMHGHDVATWQRRMRERGFVDVAVDGEFGPRSARAATWLALYLELPATGTVDEALWRAAWAHA